MPEVEPDNESTVEITAVGPIAEDLLGATNSVLQQLVLHPLADKTWLELECQDGQTFAPNEMRLRLAVPPTAISVGDYIDIENTESAGQIFPTMDKPELPAQLAFARRVTRGDGVLVANADMPKPQTLLFAVKETAPLLERVAVIATYHGPDLQLRGSGKDSRILLVGGGENSFAWCYAAAESLSDFKLQVHSPRMPTDRRLFEAGLEAYCDDDSPLLLRGDDGTERLVPRRALLFEPAFLPGDYFEDGAHGQPEAIEVQTSEDVALALATSLAEHRRARVVSASVNDDDELVITSDQPVAAVRIRGPGFTTLGGRRGFSLNMPFSVALSMAAGARRGRVTLCADAGYGCMHRHDVDVIAQWTLAPA